MYIPLFIWGSPGGLQYIMLFDAYVSFVILQIFRKCDRQQDRIWRCLKNWISTVVLYSTVHLVLTKCLTQPSLFLTAVFCYKSNLMVSIFRTHSQSSQFRAKCSCTSVYKGGKPLITGNVCSMIKAYSSMMFKERLSVRHSTPVFVLKSETFLMF